MQVTIVNRFTIIAPNLQTRSGGDAKTSAREHGSLAERAYGSIQAMVCCYRKPDTVVYADVGSINRFFTTALTIS